MYKVWLVEDESQIREGIKRMIEQLCPDFGVTREAAHGKEAMELLGSDIPDLIISDIRMREMDGLTFIREVRKRYADLPVMIISGYQDFHYAQEAIRCEVADYLLKPVSRKAFLTALEKIRNKLNAARGILPPVSPPPIAPADSSPESGSGSGAAGQPEAHRSPAQDKYTIRTIKEYIINHPEDDLSLNALASLVALHPAYVSSLFKTETGQNLSDFITEARMERAKYLLTHTQLKVYDVARLSGYPSPKHFALVFKQQTGMPPGAYRDQFAAQ
ncbi:response regulator [Paenibacillus doosanensis]|uniref:response regulator transcription factor n=1 Tax=Paenibacillus doosanensis TaxID=1229154 RepID=UPI0021804A5C|nr:response regulator [Paenibacillus doosanensis]MCS7463024.1 response regulator [Paenibacillus doosanensis]